MEPLDFSDVQKQLVRCQQLLDEARQEGWSPERIVAFDEATRELHEGAVIRRALASTFAVATQVNVEEATKASTTSSPLQAEDAEPPAVNRLLSPEERGEAVAKSDSQVDLLSSIGELTLAEKLALQPLSDVSEGMSIVDRAQFTSVLFSGEEEVFSALLTKLTRASTQEEALAQFQEALSPRGEDVEVDALKEDFAKRIMRTFVS